MWPFKRRRKAEIELRMTVNGVTILQGDVRDLRNASIYGGNTGNNWYDLLNGATVQFRPEPGSKITLEIREAE